MYSASALQKKNNRVYKNSKDFFSLTLNIQDLLKRCQRKSTAVNSILIQDWVSANLS